MSHLINKQSYELCLAACLYRCYENDDPVLKYHPAGALPLDITYSKPTIAKKYKPFLTAQYKVNRTLRRYLEPAFEKIYLDHCREDFSSHLNTIACRLIGDSDVERSTPMKLLARFAFKTEAILFCFRHGCFRRANCLPEYLHDVLREEEFKDIFTSSTKDEAASANAAAVSHLSTRPVVEEEKSSRSDGYRRFKSYCKELSGQENHPTLNTFKQIGEAFQREPPPVEIEQRLEPGGIQLQEPKCRICYEKCLNYLKEFIAKCDKEYGTGNTCSPKVCTQT